MKHPRCRIVDNPRLRKGSRQSHAEFGLFATNHYCAPSSECCCKVPGNVKNALSERHVATYRIPDRGFFVWGNIKSAAHYPVECGRKPCWTVCFPYRLNGPSRPNNVILIIILDHVTQPVLVRHGVVVDERNYFSLGVPYPRVSRIR